VPIIKLVSDAARAEFLYFIIALLHNKPNLKIWQPRKYASIYINQLLNYKIHTILWAVIPFRNLVKNEFHNLVMPPLIH
jgi:hypothetical protein